MKKHIHPCSGKTHWFSQIGPSAPYAFALAVALSLGNIAAFAQISIPNAGFTYTQDFNTLAASGASNTAVPAGWAFFETSFFFGANTTYRAEDAFVQTFDTYSFGATGNSDRAFGSITSVNQDTLNTTIGVCFTNNTGATITSLTITYTGETWRVSSQNRQDGLVFQYNQNTTGINGPGTWTAFSALNYFNPGDPTLGGGSIRHSAGVSSTISGLNIAPGNTFCFRWLNFDAPALGFHTQEDALGIDDFSLSNIVACDPPVVTAPTVTQPTCATPTGTIVVNATGSGALEYSVDNGMNWDTDPSFGGLAPGNYFIKVRLQANPTCEAPYGSNPVVLNSPFTVPSCSVTGPASVCANSTGNVYTAAAGMSAYSWNVTGSGSIVGSAAGSSITVTAGASGTYTVNVTVTNASGCTNTCNQVVTVSGQPACSVTGPATVCPSATSTFNAPAGLSMYSWTVTGNGSISGAANGASVSVIAQASGTYTVNVTITSSTGCTNTCNQVVNISTLPDATITGGGTYCGGSSVSLSAPAGGASYAWGKYNNLTGAPGYPQIGTGNPFSVTKSGRYSVTVTNAAGCSAVGFTDVIVADYTINGSLGPGDTQKPNRLLRIGATGVTCAVPKSCPGTTGVGEVHYYDVHNFTNTQNAPVCVTIALNSPCGTSIFMAAYSAPFNPANSCANYLGDPATSFFASQTGTMEVTVPANGTLSVLVEVVPNGGTCSDYTLGVDILAAFPGLTVTASATNACQGTAFNLSATAITNAAYSWAGSGVTASATNATTATPVASGSQTYTVTVSTVSGCKPTTATKVVSVNTVPGCPSDFGPPFNGQTGVTFLDSLRWTPVPNITHYLVYFGNNAPNYDNILNGVNNGISTSRGMSLSLVANTTYGYRIVPVNACGQAVGCPTITFTTCLPSFTCPANRDVNLNANCAMVIPDLVTGLMANPGCGSLTFTQNPTAGTVVSSSHNGTVSVTITPSNPSVPSCQVTLTGKDVTQPAFACPANRDVNLNATCQLVVPNLIAGLTGTDNCGMVTFTQNPTAGTAVASSHNGTVTVTITASDGNGNTSTCQVTLTGKDVTQPNFACPANRDVNLNAPCQLIVPNLIAGLTGTDNCGTVTFTQNPTAGTAVASSHNGTVLVTITANDGKGNTSNCSVTLTGKDVTQPTFACPANRDVNLNATCQLVVPDLISGLTGTDNCGTVSFTQNPAANTAVASSHNGTVLVTITANDGKGNTSNCSVTLTGKDVTQPTFACPANRDVNLNATCQLVVPNLISGLTGTDNCGTVSFTQNPAANTAVASSHNGTVMVTITANDGNGNTSTCQVTLTGKDVTPPTVQCFNQTLNFNGEESIALDADDLAEASDNCGVQSISLSPNTISAERVGQIVPVTVTVTDINGNTATCTSNITVSGFPAGWSQQPGGAGCSGNNNTYNSGTGVWTATSTNCFYGPPYTSDATSFVQRTLCGNGSLTAQVTSISGSALGWAGIVMRESNAPGAKKAQLMTNLSSLHRREVRTTTNGAAQPQQSASNGRYWLRITRAGNQFTMSVSANGTSWFLIGAQTIVMGNCIQMGLVATNYTANSTVTATFAGVSYTGSNATAASYEPRAASLESPYSFEVYPNPTSGELNLDLTQYIGRSIRIETYSLEGKLLQFSEIEEVQTTVEQLDMSQLENGMYLVKVRAVARDGISRERISRELPDAVRRIVINRN